MLKAKYLNCGYTTPILKNINLEIDRGELCFLIGPNGCGKSTLLKSLGGIIQKLNGEVLLNDEAVDFGSSIEKRPSYLAPSVTAQPGLTGRDVLDLYNYKNSSWCDPDMLDFLQIQHLLKSPLEELSSGERQRIFIAATLAHPSCLVLMDEPFSFLDWDFSLKLCEILREQTGLGRSFLIANHNLEWSLKTPSRTLVLGYHELILDGTTTKVLVDSKLQALFGIKTHIMDNPLESSNILVISRP